MDLSYTKLGVTGGGASPDWCYQENFEATL